MGWMEQRDDTRVYDGREEQSNVLFHTKRNERLSIWEPQSKIANEIKN